MEKLKLIANALIVLDSIGMTTVGVDRQIGRTKSVLRLQRNKGLRRHRIENRFTKF